MQATITLDKPFHEMSRPEQRAWIAGLHRSGTALALATQTIERLAADFAITTGQAAVMRAQIILSLEGQA